MKKHFSLIASVVMLALLSACGAPSAATGGITVQESWVRAVTAGDQPAEGEHGDHGEQATATADDATSGVVSAAYMTIVNSGAADQLLSVSTEVAEAVELHNLIVENNVGRMRPVQNVEVPANGQVAFEPGGYHVMLIGVKQTLAPGDTVPLTLTFQKAGQIEVQAEVRAP
jgi:copper(I)-binding protein